jgi:hypothetical protein
MKEAERERGSEERKKKRKQLDVKALIVEGTAEAGTNRTTGRNHSDPI